MMFLHLGSDWAVAVRDVVSIHDYAIFADEGNRKYLNQIEEQGRLVDCSEKNPKAVVVTADKVYVSAISSLTLKRRANQPFPIE